MSVAASALAPLIKFPMDLTRLYLRIGAEHVVIIWREGLRYSTFCNDHGGAKRQ